MAINARLIEAADTLRLSGARADALQMPPNNSRAIVAAGSYDISADSELFIFKNLSNSQLVYVRLNLDADAITAGSADSKSIPVEPGESFAFGLAPTLDASSYKLDVQ